MGWGCQMSGLARWSGARGPGVKKRRLICGRRQRMIEHWLAGR